MKQPEIAIFIREPLISRGVIYYVRRLYPDAAIDVFTSLPQVKPGKNGPQIILLDPTLLTNPKADHLEKLYTDHPESKIIGLGSKTPDEDLMRFFCAFIPLNATEAKILALLESCINDLDQQGNAPENIELISEREKEVLRGVALGMTNNEISDMLHISSHTVITHRKNISAKLGIKTIAGLAIYAVLNGIISPEEMEE